MLHEEFSKPYFPSKFTMKPFQIQSIFGIPSQVGHGLNIDHNKEKQMSCLLLQLTQVIMCRYLKG